MITARDFRNLSAGANQAEYTQLERRIDSCVMNAVMLGRLDGDPIRVSVDGVSEVTVERAVSEYTIAGWRCTVVDEYTQGRILQLRSR